MKTCASLLLCSLMLIAGCGGPTMAPVTGKVTWKGKPVAQAFVTFAPIPKSEKDKEAGKPGTDTTNKDGVYRLSTFRNYDGALVGKHNVNVILDDANPARCKRSTQLTLEVKPGSNELNIELE